MKVGTLVAGSPASYVSTFGKIKHVIAHCLCLSRRLIVVGNRRSKLPQCIRTPV